MQGKGRGGGTGHDNTTQNRGRGCAEQRPSGVPQPSGAGRESLCSAQAPRSTSSPGTSLGGSNAGRSSPAAWHTLRTATLWQARGRAEQQEDGAAPLLPPAPYT